MLGSTNLLFPQSLPALQDGSRARVVELQASPRDKARLEALGLGPGAEVTKVSAAPHHGPLVILFGGGSVALSYNLAKSLKVVAVPDSQA